MTLKAKRFIAANRESAIVYGSVIGGDRGPEHVEGCFYRLQNGRTFKLTVEDCRAIAGPRWLHVDAPA